MNAPHNVKESSAALRTLLTYLDKNFVPFEGFSCFAAVSEDKSTIFTCPMNVDGLPERDEDDPRHMNWIVVTAPVPAFVGAVNSVFGTSFQWANFSGR